MKYQTNINSFKREIEEGRMPRYLYKFREINDCKSNNIKDSTKKIITNSELWFSKPSDFNDPFDCQIISDTKNTKEEIKNFLKQNHFLTRKELAYRVEYYHKNSTEWHSIMKNTIPECLNNTGICCFANNKDSILMWSHYADSHKGICLKFDVLQDLNFFSGCIKVEYKAEYPKYNLARDSSSLVQHHIQTKSQDWHYEGEVRLLAKHSGPYKFNSKALVEIYFGCNCPKAQEIKNLAIENNFKHLKFKKAKISTNKYMLNFD